MRRKILFIVSILCLAIIGVALYRHWMEVALSSPNDGQSQLTVRLDQNKFREDIASFRGNRTSQTEFVSKEIRGKLLTVDTGQNLVSVQRDSTPVTVDVPVGTKIQLENREGSLADLRPGMAVAVSYVERDGRNSAQSITVQAP